MVSDIISVMAVLDLDPEVALSRMFYFLNTK